MKKKSPVKFTGYQKRYFMIRDAGKLLAYFSRKPKSGDEPKGVLLMHLITEIEVVDESKFIIQYPERPFILRADNSDTQAMWVSGLRLLIEKTKQEAPVNSEVLPAGNWKNKKLTDEVAQIVKLEADVPSPAPKLSDSTDINVQIMVTKGIWKYFSEIPAKIIKRHVLFGFLNKRSKGALKYFQKRWFILISGAPIVPTVEEEVLKESNFPPWMYMNHIYYYKYEGPEDDSDSQGEIPTRLITIRIKDMSNSKDTGASFLVDLGTRLYHLNAETEEIMNQWVKAIEISKENAQEVTSSITGRPKYIKKIVQLFDSHGPSALKGKILDTFKEKTAVLPGNPEDIKEILDIFSGLTEDMISTIDGCVSHRPQRLDIAEIYAQTFHKKLCEVLASIWRSLAPSITSENLLKLIAWTNNYNTQLNSIGINDQRISNGITVLSIAFSNNFFENACNVLYEGLKRASLGEVDIDAASTNYVVCYGDLCSLIEPVMLEIQALNAPQFAAEALDVIREVVTSYKNAVTEACERNLVLPLACVAGFCNDSVLIIQRFKTWQIMAKSQLDASVINNNLRTKYITQEITGVEQLAKNTFVNSLLERVDSSFEMQFHELKMDLLFPQIVGELNDIEPYTDRSLVDYVWKRLMEKIIRKYVNSVFQNQQSLKTQSILLLSETLRSDASMFLKYFSMKFDKMTVEIELQALRDIVEFLEALPSSIAEACAKVKNTQGEEFTFTVAVIFT